MIRVSPDEKCPCESGRVLRSCCLTAGGALKPVAAVTWAPAPKTGIRNEGCYAAALADCSADIAREHYISHALLRLLGIEERVTVDGFPWQDAGASRRVAPAALTGKILCSRHNRALSPLDAVASRLFQRIDQFHHEIVDSALKYQNRFFLFNGHDIERWMLKTLCGAVVSGNAEIRTGESNWRPSLEWLKILFVEEPFPPRCGLYFHSEVTGKPYIERGFKFISFSNKIGGVYGARISLNDERFGWEHRLSHRGATIEYQTTGIGSQL